MPIAPVSIAAAINPIVIRMRLSLLAHGELSPYRWATESIESGSLMVA